MITVVIGGIRRGRTRAHFSFSTAEARFKSFWGCAYAAAPLGAQHRPNRVVPRGPGEAPKTSPGSYKPEQGRPEPSGPRQPNTTPTDTQRGSRRRLGWKYAAR